MSLEFMDNFSNYGDDETNLTDGVYADRTGITLTADPDGVSGGKVIQAVNGYNFRKVLSAAQTTIGVAFRIWPTQLPTASSNCPGIVCFNDTVNAVQCMIRLNTDGTISAYRGDVGTLLGTTAVPVVTAGAWTHIEVKAVLHQTTGSIEVRINGAQKLLLENQDTINSASTTTCTQVRFGNQNGAPLYMKDLYIWNGGGSLYNDFVGDVHIVTLSVTGDSSFNWSASTGTTGYDLIDETTPNDLDYIYADDTPPAASVFTLSDLPEDVTSVKGLMTFGRMMKTDGGDAQVQISLISGGDEANGSDRPITVAETYWFDAQETDPDTTAAWTRTAVNAATIKVDRTV